MSGVDANKKYFVVKMPYYPLNCLEVFLDYFNGDISLLYVQRPKERIVKSYLRRGEDRYFLDPVEHVRQVKKLGLKGRKRYLASEDAEGFFGELVSHSAAQRRRWDQNNPEHKFIEVDIERFFTSRQYLSDVLRELGLSTNPTDEMLALVNVDRLLKGKRRTTLRKLLHQVLPPFIWTLAIQLRDRIPPEMGERP